MSGTYVTFNRSVLFSRFYVQLGGNRATYVTNRSKHKGASLLGTVVKFIPLEGNGVGMKNVLLRPAAVSTVHERVT